MKKIISRIISVILLVLAVVAVCGIFTAKGSGFLDFSNLARMLFGVIAVLCVSLAAVLWKMEDKKYNKIKVVLWIVAVLVIAFAVFGSKWYKKPSTEMITSGSAVAAKMETSDGKIIYVDSEIAVLKSFAGLHIHEAPMEPTDSEDDWIYRITFNPSEKVSGSEEIVVSFHDAYVQINNEYYLPDEGVEYSSIMEWVQSKAVYMFK